MGQISSDFKQCLVGERFELLTSPTSRTFNSELENRWVIVYASFGHETSGMFSVSSGNYRKY